MLTKIEKLDGYFPGLAARVAQWFAQGVPVLKVVDLLRVCYGVTVPKSTLGNYRSRRWTREQENHLGELARRGAAGEEQRIGGWEDRVIG